MSSNSPTCSIAFQASRSSHIHEVPTAKLELTWRFRGNNAGRRAGHLAGRRCQTHTFQGRRETPPPLHGVRSFTGALCAVWFPPFARALYPFQCFQEAQLHRVAVAQVTEYDAPALILRGAVLPALSSSTVKQLFAREVEGAAPALLLFTTRVESRACSFARCRRRCHRHCHVHMVAGLVSTCEARQPPPLRVRVATTATSPSTLWPRTCVAPHLTSFVSHPLSPSLPSAAPFPRLERGAVERAHRRAEPTRSHQRDNYKKKATLQQQVRPGLRRTASLQVSTLWRFLSHGCGTLCRLGTAALPHPCFPHHS